MPKLTRAIIADGALVDVQVGWSAGRSRQLRATLKPVPPAISARAILDTGAEMTRIDVTIVRALGLTIGGTVLANLPAHGGLIGAGRYEASTFVVHPSGSTKDNLAIPDLSVLELSLASLGYEVILGRDVLARCRFLYDGPANQFELEY
jgi:hypothetical protein